MQRRRIEKLFASKWQPNCRLMQWCLVEVRGALGLVPLPRLLVLPARDAEEQDVVQPAQEPDLIGSKQEPILVRIHVKRQLVPYVGEQVNVVCVMEKEDCDLNYCIYEKE